MPQNENSKGPSQLSWSDPQKGGPSVHFNQKVAPVHKPSPVASPAHQANTNRSVAKIVGWLAVGVVAGVILAWGATKSLTHIGVSGSQGATSVSSTNESGAAASSLLTVTSPQKAGVEVVISDVSVSAPTWVVVYESRDGKPGNVLGASLFFPGGTSGTIELLRGTTAGQTYFVTERTDNGDHQFSLVNDPLVSGADGQPQWASFVAN
jgi:hypothetical protein